VRLEYVVVGFILVIIILIVALSMLSGIVPSFEAVLNLLKR